MATSPYPFSTTWTGKGDGTNWSDPANWSDGVPLTGADSPDAPSDIATIDNSVEKTPFTVVIAGQFDAGEVDIDLVDPIGGVAVSLTGTLGLSINATPGGSGFGVLNLASGTFEIDGGTLGGGEVVQKGGTLAFGSYAKWGVDTLAGAIIDGPTAIDNASTVVIQQSNFAIFDGLGGYGTPAAVTILDGSTLSLAGSLYLTGEIDVQNGTLSLDGGNLQNWGGAGTLYADGGAIDLTQDTAVNADYIIEGGLTFTGSETLTVSTSGELTLGNDALAPTVVNLDGGTLDVSGALNLDNTVLENGSLILESGSTYQSDGMSSLSGVTVTDNRPAGQTNWTGAGGDDDWSNAANWTHGVPQSGLNFTTDGQSVAVINNIIDTNPSTIVISGDVNAEDIYVNTTDPAGGPSVSLTGTLDTSYGNDGGAYGYLDLTSGTFEIDGGSLNNTGVGLNGGTLAFGTAPNVVETLTNDIINGNFAISGSVVQSDGYNIFHGQGGGGPSTTTLSNNGQLIVADGTLAIDGTLDIQGNNDNTLVALDGGNLLGYGGDAANIFIDGGTFAIDASTTFSNTVNIYGGYMVIGETDAVPVITIDTSSVTSIGQAGGARTTVNLNGGTLDVFGTLNLTNTYIENGTITVEAGATFNQDATDTLEGVTVQGGLQTATNWTGAGDGTSWSDANNWDNGVPVSGGPYPTLGQNVTTIDNTHGDAAPFTVVISGDQAGALVIVNATDPTGGVAVRIEGSLNLALDEVGGSAMLGVLDANGGTVEIDGGTLNVLNINQLGGHVTFGSFAQWGAATLNASGIAGDLTIGNASELIIAQNSFGAFNYADQGTANTVTISDNSTLDIQGSLYSTNNIDIVSGSVILDGGSLGMGAGTKLVSEGGGLSINGDGTLNSLEYDGAVSIGAGNTLTISGGNTALISNAGGQYAINLDTGTLDVKGTLEVEGVITATGDLDLETGSTLQDATVNAPYQFDDPTININGNATLENVTIDAPIVFNAAATLTIAGTETFGNATDSTPMTVDLNGGVLDVTGALDLTNTDITGGTIVIEAGGSLTTDAASALTGVTLEETLANGDLEIVGENVAITSLQTITTANGIDLLTGVSGRDVATGTPGEVTFNDPTNDGNPIGFTGAGTITVTDGSGVSYTDFNGATLAATVAGQILDFVTDTYSANDGSFSASNGGTLTIGDANYGNSNLAGGVLNAQLSATGGSTVQFYGGNGISVVNGQITLDATSTIEVATAAGDVSLAQSLTSIGSANPTTYLDQLGILNLNGGASFIDPNAVILYGTVNLTGGTFSTAGLTGNLVVFNSGFGEDFASGVLGFGALKGAFGSTSGSIYMEASGGTLTYTGTLSGFDNLIADTNSTLIVESNLDSQGYTNGYGIDLKAGSTIELDGAIGDTTNVYTSFQGSNATLQIDDAAGVTYGNIQAGSGAYSNDVIDLAGLVAATLPDGTPDVTITRYVNGAVTVSIVPVGGGAAAVFTIDNAANTKVTFNPDDGKGGSQILLTADPVITAPGLVYATQGIASAISGISLVDNNLGSGQTITVTVDDVNGLLAATGASGSGTTSLTVTGTLAQIGAALATLTVLESNLGSDALAVSAVDSDGNSAATQAFQIYTEAPIVVEATTGETISQNLATQLGSPYVFEQGALSGADLTVTVADTTGILTASGSGISGSGTNTITFTGSTSAINAGLSALTITEATPGTDTVTFNANDAAGDKAQTTTTVISTLSKPAIDAPASAAVTQNSITPLTGISISEAGAPSYDQFTVTLTDSTGLLSATGAATTGVGATSITLTGSLTQINADLLTLAVDEPNTGSDTLNLAVTDNYGGIASTSVAIGSTHQDAPDLTVGAITAPSTGVEGQSVQVSWTVTNSGDATAKGPWTDNVYVATDASGDNKVLVGSFTYTGTLAAGQSETQTQTVTVPSSLTVSTETGTAAGYFVVQADAGNQTGALTGIQNHLTVATTSTAVTASVSWTSFFGKINSGGIDATDYALIEQRWVTEVGTTDASLATAINQTITALDKTSATPATSSDALSLLARQAVGGLVDQTLAQITDPSGRSTGLDTLLTPNYSSDLADRNNSGVFGDGWVSEFNDVGALGPMNGLDPSNSASNTGSYVITYVTTYVDQYGNFLRQAVTYQVVAPAVDGLNFLDPTNPQSNYTQTNANGTTETFSGMTGLVIGISDANGNAITINRNSANVITSIATASGNPPTFTVNAQGNITSATDSAGKTITYTYDATGTHLLSTTSSAGTTSYQYSTSSNPFIQNALTQVTAPAGTTQAYTYNAQGDIASQSTNGAAPTTYTYSGPNTIAQTNGNGETTTSTYDQNGETTSITDPGGNTYTIERNADGQPVSVTNGAGQTATYTYDAKGNLTGYTDALGNSVAETYVSGTSNVSTITDQDGNTTTYSYNTAGQLSGVTQGNAAGAQYQYNAQGQLSVKTEATGATIQYTYNAAGKLATEAFSDGTSQSYAYDAKGNLTSSTAVDGGVTTYTYTAQNLLASVTNAAGQVERYSYNAAGQETQRVEPDGTITNYAYTTSGLLAEMTDGSGNVIARYAYDAAGLVTVKTTGNGASTLYTYDASGNVTQIKTLASDGSTTSNLTYTYNANSQIATATSGDGTWTYTYDAASQVTHAVFASTNASIASQDLTYAYDAAGNRTQTIFNGATTNYSTNNLNQYTSADGTTYGYDANGNLITKTSGGVTTTYTYNVLNQLASSTDGTSTTTYAYDALGNIASQTVNGVLTSYVSDPLAIYSTATGPLSAIAQAYNASGQATATYTYGLGLTSVTTGGATDYYNADASGNITSLSGANGALTDTYVYSPTGTVLNSTGTVANPFQFNGLVGATTQADGLVNTRARTYDPVTGRFTTADPSGQAGGLNLYTYAANNPLNYVDATGDDYSPAGFLSSLISVGAGIVAVAGATVLSGPVLVFVLAGGALSYGTGLYGLYDSSTKPAGYHDSAGDYGSLALNGGLNLLGGGLLKGPANLLVNGVSDLNSAAGLAPGYGNLFTAGGDLNQTIDDTDIIYLTQGGGWGDVHLTTFDGLHFNFQAVGEFVLVKSTVAGDNFQVQIRLSTLGNSDASAPTLTTEIGIKVGSQTITFAADRSSTVYLDGVPADLSLSSNTLSLAGGTITALSQDTYQVTEKTGEVVNITNNGSYFSYTVDLAPGAQPGSVEGLLGSDTGTANAFQLPDGTALGANVTSDQLYQTFGNAWRITDATSLLNYAPGETTATYTDLTHPATDLSIGSLPTAVVQAATAAVAAAGLTGTAAADALYDYLVTGNPSLITNAAADGAQAPVTSTAVVTPNAAPPPSIGISPAAPAVAEVSNQTPVTFTVSLTGTATADTVVDYNVLATAIDSGKSYFDAADFGGTLPSGTVTILAGQSTAQITVEIPDSALGTTPDKWLALGISTPGTDPIYASTAQVDVINDKPVAGVAAQPVLEYVPGNTVGVSEIAPALTRSGNSYTLNLGNVVQGTSLAALQFALANTASAPADSLVAMVLAATGSAANANGLQSATLITAGNAATGLTLQPLTAALGAQTETVTLGAMDVNGTGYDAALSNITLTVTENIVSAAKAAIGTTAVVLPDVRIGSTDTQTITVTNSAASGAAPLDVTVSASNGATATGSIAQLAAGASNSTSLSVGIPTTAAGQLNGLVTLNLASDLGNGVEVPLALNQSVSVTGSVYRAAAASIAQAATIVHVGDAGSQDLSILDSDPADGYSEGLRATVTGTTGGISASGTTGLIAAGATDASSVLVSYSTATSGVISGQVNLGLTSDGTGVDTLTPISIGTDAVAFNVQVDNYASADFQKTGGNGTLTGSAATGYDIDLGTIIQGGSAATVDLAALNSAAGLADLLSGSFAVTGDSAFTNTGFSAFNGLGAGQSDGALSIGLSTVSDGTFTETITLTGSGSNASGYSGAVAPVTVTIHGTVSAETPVIVPGTIVTGAITELPATTGAASIDTVQGTIAYTDANLSSTHAASVTSVSASGVTSGLPGNGALLSLLSLGTLSEDTASNPGSVSWDFAAADSTFDYLAAGETLTLTYAIQIAEVGGKSATQDIAVTVTGTNDLPVIAAGTTPSATITAIVAGAATPANDTASGTILFTDPDLSDTHTATIASVASSGTVAGLPSNATLLALLSTTAVTEQAGTAAGSVGWNFAAPDATFAYLMPGQTVTLDYAVNVSDNHGGSAVQDFKIVVTGAAGSAKTYNTPGTFLGVGYASSSDDYTASGFRYLETFYSASGATVATASFQTNGGYTYTVGGVVAQVKTVNGDGTFSTHYSSSGSVQGIAYASYTMLFSATGAYELQTYYDASNTVLATKAYMANGGYTYTVGGVVNQVRTGNTDGTFDIRYYTSATFLGVAYASNDITYAASGFKNGATYYDASGNVAATASYQTNGGYTYTVGGVVAQAKTVNGDGTFSTHYSSSGAVQGIAYASYTMLFSATGAYELQTYYDASNTVLATKAYTANGGYTYTVGGVVNQVRTGNTDGTFDIRYYTSATFLGVAYASNDITYAASGFKNGATYYDASGNVAATASFQTNGGYTYTVGGVVAQVKTVNGDGTFSTHYSSSGSVQGIAYASYTMLFSATGAYELQTYYDASNTVLATKAYTANGGYTYTVGGVVNQVRTGNTDGTFDIRYYTSATFLGVAYASNDITYAASGFKNGATYYDASGNVAATASFQTNGGYTYTVGGVVAQVKTVNGDGTFSTHYSSSGSVQGIAYASYTMLFSATGAYELQTYYDASNAVLATKAYTANGGYTYTVGGVVKQVRTGNTDGSYLFENENVTGQSFTQSNFAYNAAGSEIATTETLINGSNSTTLKAAGLTLTTAAGAESISFGVDAFQLGADTHGALDISGAVNATLAYGTGDGAQIITGFATAGAGADALSFSQSVFADYAHLMGATKQQGSDLLITLDANDTLLLKNVTMSSFTSANAHFT